MSYITASCKFRVVWCTKYRRDVLSDDAAEVLRAIARGVCEKHGATFHRCSVYGDRAMLVISCNLPSDVERITREIKAKSSPVLRSKFPEIKSRVPTLWTRHFYVETVEDDAGDMGAFIEAAKTH